MNVVGLGQTEVPFGKRSQLQKDFKGRKPAPGRNHWNKSNQIKSTVTILKILFCVQVQLGILEEQQQAIDRLRDTDGPAIRAQPVTAPPLQDR